jgi:hypothetical protein
MFVIEVVRAVSDAVMVDTREVQENVQCTAAAFIPVERHAICVKFFHQSSAGRFECHRGCHHMGIVRSAAGISHHGSFHLNFVASLKVALCKNAQSFRPSGPAFKVDSLLTGFSAPKLVMTGFPVVDLTLAAAIGS